ncbi:MAG: acyl-CoA dehydrogenase C-terminal domain-containing protein, partial [Pseudomonas sp.]|nr:acyl-CoA dehydrogenase C-terminal domain-containing protein [Pseudomonas sp.]
PKFLVEADGSLGARNPVNCGSIEHKMGIKASATCVMNFDGAIGYLVGEPNKGLAAMFTMMNYERLSIGIQGIGCAEASYQSAVEYARERLQGRAPGGAQQPEKSADPIIAHPDVRRMLLTMKALTEGGRAFATWVGQQLDLAKFSDNADERNNADALIALLTPVAKAFFTDTGLESCIHGQQVFGGHGYIREWGQEQLVRDVRIAQIYEGTNGIQALDLLGRKVLGNQRASLRLFAAEIRAFVDSPAGTAQPFASELLAALERLESVSAWLAGEAARDPAQVGAAAVDYLHLFGYVAYAFMWARMAAVATERRASDEAFYAAKLATARFYFAKLLPRIHALEAGIRAGSEPLYGLAAEQF